MVVCLEALENARNLLVFEGDIGFLGWCICRKQPLSIGQQLLRAIPAQNRDEVFTFFIVGRDKAVLVQRPFDDL